jgi:hypothetical protein
MKDVRRDCLTLGHRLQLRMLAYMLGSGHGRESTADEDVPVPGPPLVKSSYFMRCRRQAPTGRHANPTLAGGSDDEAADTNRCRARAPLSEGSASGALDRRG